MNYKNLEKTFAFLHENPPAPFNPSYNQGLVDKCKACQKEIADYSNSLPESMPDQEFNDLVDRKTILLYSENEIYGYKFVDGKPYHPAPVGKERIARLFPQ